MKTIGFLMLSMIAVLVAHADFSYTTVSKTPAGERTSKHYIKGQKSITDDGDRLTIMDLDAQTMTTIDKTQKTYSVRPFSELFNKSAAAGMSVNADVKKTGQHKTINGFNASEFLMTIQVEMAQARAGMKMQMEMDLWVSPDVPGSQELKAFYQKNMGRFPWAAMAPGGNPSMQKAMVDLQRKMAGLNGVPVMEVVRMKAAGSGGDAQNAQLAQARARLEEMQKQGGPQAAAAAQALARMGGGSGGGSMFETTMESTNFSTAAIPDSVFAIPAGFTKADK